MVHIRFGAQVHIHYGRNTNLIPPKEIYQFYTQANLIFKRTCKRLNHCISNLWFTIMPAENNFEIFKYVKSLSSSSKPSAKILGALLIL